MKTTETKPNLFLIHELAESIVSDGLWPSNNFIGASILARLLDVRLAAAGQLVTATRAAGPLNHSIFSFEVVSAHEGATVILDTLKEFSLNIYAHLYRVDTDEIILRNLFPPGAADVTAQELTKQIFQQSSGWLPHMADSITKINAELRKRQLPSADPSK